MITLDLPPVGIKLLDRQTVGDYAGVTLFSGVSYCQAVFGATFGMELLLAPGSVKVCKWVPVVLGFKDAENDFERTIEPHLEPVTPGIFIAPLHLFRHDASPDIVILRTKPDNFRSIIGILGWKSFIDHAGLRQDRTALHAFRMNPPSGLSALAIRYFNGALDLLNRFTLWHGFTALLFRSSFVTRIFDRFITRYMANMSMCRNSLVIPLLERRANISYFCTGGIAWGKNDSRNMTAGFPHDLFLALAPRLDYPGKTRDDPRLEALEKVKKRLLKSAKGRGCTIAPVDGREAQ